MTDASGKMAAPGNGRLIVIVPVGKAPAEVLSHVRSTAATTFNRLGKVGDSLSVPRAAFSTERGQISASAIARRLPLDGAERVLGVIDHDLYVPELNFVFGIAQGARALIALPRLRESFYGRRDDPSGFLARVAKEAVHELGHTYGLGHCRDRRCVMAFSNSLGDTDAKTQEFCRACRARLPE